MKIQENILLSDFTSFRVGGPARFFANVTNLDELFDAQHFAAVAGLPTFVLAGGSNVVVSSAGFSGLVIHPEFTKVEISGETVFAGSGVAMKTLVDATIDAGLAGLEWAGGLPGSLGGAIRGNAGAFRGEIKDSIKAVEAYSLHSNERREFDRLECEFEYRGSFFKRHPDWLITAGIFTLTKGEKEQLRAIADDHIAFRQQRHPMNLPNAGSMFKNTPVARIPQRSQSLFENVIKVDPFPVVPTGKVIEDAGLKGFRVGDAQISEKHCNYVVNLGNATGEQILELVTEVKKIVFTKFGIELETEPEFLGF